MFNADQEAILSTIHAFPCATDITIDARPMTVDIIQELVKSCPGIRRLNIGAHDGDIALGPVLKCLETAKFGLLLEHFTIGNTFADSGDFWSFCRSFPNIVRLELRLEGHPVRPTDIRALITLKQLESFAAWVERSAMGPEGEPARKEMADAFTVLGQAEGAAPFKRLELCDATFDATAFFLSRRCHEIRELDIDRCEFTEASVRALATNVKDSLVKLTFSSDGWNLDPEPRRNGHIPAILLAECSQIHDLSLTFATDDILRQIGEQSRARLTRFDIYNFRPDHTEAGFRAFAPALRFVITLKMYLPRCPPEVIRTLISSCPQLRVLKGVSGKIIKELALSPNIELR